MDQEEDAEFRKLELKYEALYLQIYNEREKVLMGTDLPSKAALLQEYDERSK